MLVPFLFAFLLFRFTHEFVNRWGVGILPGFTKVLFYLLECIDSRFGSDSQYTRFFAVQLVNLCPGL